MSTELESAEGRVIVRYTDERVKEMLNIREKCCFSTQQMIIEQMKKNGLTIGKIRHADKPNGIIDIIIKFTGQKQNLMQLRKDITNLQNEDIGIEGIGVYTPI
ncbi:MAG: hypothetical protein R1F52_04245 [Candidatus Nitrosoabyssus spongiisocia]|nr:MAG: hypothetical protein R1F52_04245 [Nitrosopumilaceae archaeon AB1(1)]